MPIEEILVLFIYGDNMLLFSIINADTSSMVNFPAISGSYTKELFIFLCNSIAVSVFPDPNAPFIQIINTFPPVYYNASSALDKGLSRLCQ